MGSCLPISPECQPRALSCPRAHHLALAVWSRFAPATPKASRSDLNHRLRLLAHLSFHHECCCCATSNNDNEKQCWCRLNPLTSHGVQQKKFDHVLGGTRTVIDRILPEAKHSLVIMRFRPGLEALLDVLKARFQKPDGRYAKQSTAKLLKSTCTAFEILRTQLTCLPLIAKLICQNCCAKILGNSHMT